MRTVRFSQLDRNGHMNNTRYLDWLADLLPSDFHASHKVQEFTLCYLNEAKEGEEISLHYTLSDGPTLTVDALRETDRIFSAQVIF